MAEQEISRVCKANALASELDAIYHRAALKLGVSDSVMSVLYTMDALGDGCQLQAVCRQCGIPKQTVNSALRRLESEGILYLEGQGRGKRVRLTDRGAEYLDKTVRRLRKAEQRAFRDWTEAEFAQYLALTEKFNIALEAEIEKMEAQTP